MLLSDSFIISRVYSSGSGVTTATGPQVVTAGGDPALVLEVGMETDAVRGTSVSGLMMTCSQVSPLSSSPPTFIIEHEYNEQ